MRRILATLAVCVTPAVAAGAAGGAPQQRGGNPRPDPGAPASPGGQIYIDGAGDVRVSGNFLAFGDVGGMQIAITDRRGDARAVLDGRRVMQPRPKASRNKNVRRTVVLRPSSRGTVAIEGCNVVATFRGNGNVTLSITGTGSVRLDGVGTFRINQRPDQSWPLQPITLPLRQTPRSNQR